MKKIFSLLLTAVMVASLASCNKKAAASKSTPLNDSVSQGIGQILAGSYMAQRDTTKKLDKDAFIKGMMVVLNADTSNQSYMDGLAAGMQVQQILIGMQEQNKLSLNKDKIVASFKEALNAKTPMTQDALMALNQSLNDQMQRAITEAKKNDPEAAKNLKEGKDYMAKQAKTGGYTKTPNGVLYKVIKQGNGEKFTEADVITVNYTGKHVNGTEFDGTQGKPVTMAVSNTVPGFAEALKLMSPGAKFLVIIPADQAYGIDGNGAIGPNETLVFEIETISKVEKGQTPAAPQAIQ